MNLFLDFMTNLKEVGLEWYKRYYSTYPAIVIDNKDPEKRGRILFKCPTVFGKDYISPIWADPSDCDLAGKGHGKFFPPYVGQWVEMCFEYGNPKAPIYHGGFYATGELPADFAADYPNVRGWVFASGSKILIGEKDGGEFVYIIHKSGSFYKLNADGSVSVNAVGNCTVTAGGKAVVTAEEINLNGAAGKILTTVTDPIVDQIYGAPTVGVPTVKSG